MVYLFVHVLILIEPCHEKGPRVTSMFYCIVIHKQTYEAINRLINKLIWNKHLTKVFSLGMFWNLMPISLGWIQRWLIYQSLNNMITMVPSFRNWWVCERLQNLNCVSSRYNAFLPKTIKMHSIYFCCLYFDVHVIEGSNWISDKLLPEPTISQLMVYMRYMASMNEYVIFLPMVPF